jgi:O-antigen/teichoic acid export membrane protein
MFGRTGSLLGRSRLSVSLVQGSLVSIGARLLDLPCRYGFHLLVASTLGVGDTGKFYIVFSTMVALAGLGRLGVDRALTRQVAAAAAKGRYLTVRRLIWRAYGVAFCASAAISALLAGAAVPASHLLLHKPELAGPLMLGAMAFIPQNLGAAAGGALAGLQRIGFSQMVYSWLWPALFCIVTLIFGTDLRHALIVIAASFAAAAVVGMGLVWFFLSRLPHAEEPAGQSVPSLLKVGLSLFTLELTQLLVASAPTIILGVVASSRTVGVFALAWRVALLVNVALSGISAMAAPKFSEAYVLDDKRRLTQVAAHTVGFGLALAVIPVLIMLAVPATLLGLLGQGFADGATTLRILAIGQLAAACFTAMPDLLGMTACTASLRRINALSLTFLLPVATGLGWALGAEGAAIAVSLTILLNGGSAAWEAHRHLGIAPLPLLCDAALRFLRGGGR